MLPWADSHMSPRAGTARGGLAWMSRRAAEKHVPMQALVELTGRCHLDCVHCYLDIKNPERNELSTAEWIQALDALRRAGTMFLTFTGGEIFLRRDIFELIQAARERNFSLRLFTSGTLLDREKVARIAELSPTAVEISIYGMQSRVHDAVTRRRGSLRKSLRAALLLRRAGVPVAIKSPMLAGTEEGHFDLIDAARRMGVGFQIDPSLMSRHDGGTEPLSSRPPVESIEKLFRDPRLVGEIPSCLPERPEPSEAPCAIARRVVKIGAGGQVYPCSSFPIAAGSLREQSFEEIWKSSELLQELRSFTMGDLQEECSGCSRQGYCGRCSAQALLEHGNFAGPSAEACDRAEARERAYGLAPPPGALRIGDAEPLGRRSVDFVPASRLRRGGGAKQQLG